MGNGGVFVGIGGVYTAGRAAGIGRTSVAMTGGVSAVMGDKVGV